MKPDQRPGWIISIIILKWNHPMLRFCSRAEQSGGHHLFSCVCRAARWVTSAAGCLEVLKEVTDLHVNEWMHEYSACPTRPGPLRPHSENLIIMNALWRERKKNKTPALFLFFFIIRPLHEWRCVPLMWLNAVMLHKTQLKECVCVCV